MKKNFLMFAAFLIFAGYAQAQTFPNAGFEAWHSGLSGISGSKYPPKKMVFCPDGWHGADSLILYYGPFFNAFRGINIDGWKVQMFQEKTFVHTGESAVKLVTEKQDTLGIFPGLFSNAAATIDILSVIGGKAGENSLKYTGGNAVTFHPESVNAWIRYAPADPMDSCFITVQTIGKYFGKDSIFGNGYVTWGGTDAGYREVNVPIDYTGTFRYKIDSIRITIGSSAGTHRTPGSTMYVDDVSMVGVPNAVAQYKEIKNTISVYPNPAGSHITFSAQQHAAYNGTLLNISGQIVKRFSFTDKNLIDVTTLSNGLYYYTITAAGNTITAGTVEVAH